MSDKRELITMGGRSKGKTFATIQDLQTENKQLRDALNEIKDCKFPSSLKELKHRFDHVRYVAIQALKEEQSEEV